MIICNVFLGGLYEFKYNFCFWCWQFADLSTGMGSFMTLLTKNSNSNFLLARQSILPGIIYLTE